MKQLEEMERDLAGSRDSAPTPTTPTATSTPASSVDGPPALAPLHMNSSKLKGEQIWNCTHVLYLCQIGQETRSHMLDGSVVYFLIFHQFKIQISYKT